MLDPASVLKALAFREPVALVDLPEERGVYALFDHAGRIRYIGKTESESAGFRDRIYKRHVTGSEGHSHKLSQAYNTGRTWRSRGTCPLEDPRDAEIAKTLRNAFCRRYCKATYYTVLGGVADGELTALEESIQSIAPLLMMSWGGKYFAAEDEPKTLLDALIDELGYSAAQCMALQRQAELFARIGMTRPAAPRR
jgi:hypothetical protein